MNIDLIEKHRDINTEHFDWWDCTYDHFAEDMLAKHITVDKMLFSGFWCQGDGASFTGHITNSKAFMETHDLTETYPWVTKLLAAGGDFDLRIERTSHHYVHENTVSADIASADMFCNLLDSDEFRDLITTQWDKNLD